MEGKDRNFEISIMSFHHQDLSAKDERDISCLLGSHISEHTFHIPFFENFCRSWGRSGSFIKTFWLLAGDLGEERIGLGDAEVKVCNIFSELEEAGGV